MQLDAWQRFRERVVANDTRALHVRNWVLLRSLLDLPQDQLPNQLRETVVPMDEVAFQSFCDTIALVSTTSWQRAGLVGLADQAEFTRRLDAYVASGGEETALFYKLTAFRQQLDSVRKSTLQIPFDAAEHAVFEKGMALGNRLMLAGAAAVPGSATEAALETLWGILAEIRAALADTPLENRMRRVFSDALEAALEVTARCSALLKRFGDAISLYDEACDLYGERGETANAARCRKLAAGVRLEVSGDVDSAVRANLTTLVFGAPRVVAPLDGTKAVVALMQQSIQAGDLFEGGNLLQRALDMQRHCGYADPFDVDIEAAFATWIDAVPTQMEGNDVVAFLSGVVSIYNQLLAGRMAVAQTDRVAIEQHAHAALDNLQKLAKRLFTESTVAEAELERMWVALSNAPLGPDPALLEKLHELNAASDRAHERVMELAQTIAALTDEIDRREAAGIALDDLLDRAQQAQSEAVALDQPTFSALAAMNEADLLLELQRPQDALKLIADARTAWTNTFNVTEGGNAQQRVLDARFLIRAIRAHAELGETQAIFDCAGEAIALVERDRYSVSSPYMQSAFLKERAELYMFGVFSAYKLGNYAELLERSELAKARSALRLHYTRDLASADVDALDRQFRSLSDQIDKAPTPDLLTDRRQVWDLLAIARMRADSASESVVPNFSLTALQATLAPTDIVVSYYWLDDNVLLVSGIDAQSVMVKRVILSDCDLANFKELSDGIATLRHNNDNFDAAIQACAPFCLPPSIGTLIEGKQRLIFSPHRALHLFPFHALMVRKARLIEHVAVSYTPSISMLLIPPAEIPEARVLLMGVNDFSSIKNETLIALPGVELELQGATTAYRDAGILTDIMENADATRTALLKLNDDGTLSNYSCIVLATHGTSVFADDTVSAPMESRLYLHDAAMTGLELARLRIRADVVVLSACCSGQRAVAGRGLEHLPGDDLFGLPAALNMAGARRIVTCLWPADDTTAPKLMQAFHRRFADGMAADLALQGAMIEHLRGGDRLEPFYWAPFFLTNMGPLAASL